jgi:hypothetical protein
LAQPRQLSQGRRGRAGKEESMITPFLEYVVTRLLAQEKRARKEGRRGPQRALRALDYAWANLEPGEHEALALTDKGGKVPYRTLLLARGAAKREGVPLDDLAEYCRSFDEWIDRTDAEHRAECSCPDKCDDAPCRLARGLKPFTPEEVRERDRKGIPHVCGHEGRH